MANRRFIDFPIAASVGDNDIVLIWQDGLNKQTTKATLLQGSPQSLAGLTDVDIAGLTNGQILQYNSTLGKWENVDRTDINLSELGDVTIVAPTNGQVLVYNSSTSKWENSSGGYVPYTGAVTTVNLGAQSILAGTFVKAGGTSAQFLKADGSVDSTAYGTGSVTSVGLTMPSAFNVANSPITTNGTLAVTGAGTVAQYIRGDGSLADFPATTGGGASVSYYLNGSVSQGTIGGVAYREVNRNPVFGAGTDISISSDGYIANFITDAGDPNKLEIPAGNWNLETYFSASSGGGNPSFYVELYKYNGSTFTLIASSATSPELIAFGTNLNPYFSTLAVPQTTLALTDRLALRFYVNTSGRTITLHTENNHLCQVITTFTTGLTALNGLTAQVQNFATGTTGTDFNIASATATHTFNLPTASGTNRGALSSTDWTTFNNKENAITAGTTAQYFRGDKTFQTLNTSVVPEGTNLYYTEARVNANTNVAANTAARHNAVTLGTANGLSLSTQVLSLGLASAGVTGALSGTDWSTFNNKQNALTNPVTGTGTTNYLAKFTGSTTVGNSQVFDNGTNVGIGTASPNAKLDIGSGDIYVRTGLVAVNTIDSYNQTLTIRSNGNTAIFIPNTQNVLVGTTTDAGYKLDVAGTLRSTGRALLGNSMFVGEVSGSYSIIETTGSNGIWLRPAGVSSPSGMFLTSSGNVGIGTSSPSSPLHVVNSSNGFIYRFAGGTSSAITGGIFAEIGRNFASIGTTSNHGFNIFTNDLDRLAITSGGNVLIGTTTDGGQRLQVNGAIKSIVSSGGSVITSESTATNGEGQFVIIGKNSSGTTRSASFKYDNADLLRIGTSSSIDFRFETNDTERMRITSGGNLLIGTSTNGASKLRISGLPTSSSGLSSGDIWNDSGTLKIA
jgi:hypothetical protein